VSRKLRLILLTMGGMAGLLALVLLGLYLATRYEPTFYREAMQIDPAALDKASDRMVQQATALANAVRNEGHWEALFTAEQINGWLAVDMVKNHSKVLPPTLHNPRVAIDSKQLVIACRFQDAGIDTVLSLAVEPYVTKLNVVHLRIIKARAGLLPMPLGPVLEHLSRAARDLHIHLQWRRSGGDPVAVLSLPAADDRQPVQVESIRLGDGEIYIAGTTLTKKP
jgi:hypothetical protein